MRKPLFLLSFCLFTAAPAVLATSDLNRTGIHQELAATDGSQRECALMAARRIAAEVAEQRQPLRNATPTGVTRPADADSAVDYVIEAGN